MKILILLLIVATTSVLALDEVYSYPYNASDMYSCFVYNDYWLCDDFTPYNKTDLRSVIFYGIYLGEPATSLNLKLLWDSTNDSDPNNDILMWEDNLPCRWEYLCEWGQYSVNRIICDMPSGPQVLAGKHYFMHVQLEGGNGFVSVFTAFLQNGSPAYIWDGEEYVQFYWYPNEIELFMVIDNEEVSLQSTTWADIKTTFGDN